MFNIPIVECDEFKANEKNLLFQFLANPFFIYLMIFFQKWKEVSEVSNYQMSKFLIKKIAWFYIRFYRVPTI